MTKKIHIGVAMSGGVDSTTCALLLQKKYHVQGFFMRLAQPDFSAQKARVEKIAQQLGVSLQVIDLRDQFESCILKYFSSSYLNGLTPNPCVICNRKIKFGLFLDAILNHGMDFMATGHYANIVENSGSYHLHTGIDSKKDQTYFLCRLDQSQLAKVMFPLGNMTKEETYTFIEQHGFHDFRGLESQDICFLDDNGIGHFLNDKASFGLKNGPVIMSDGTKIGQHGGLFNYTIGQRKGLGISSDAPLYVLELNVEKNAVIVGRNNELFSDTIRVKELHWLADNPPDLACTYSVRIRYSHRGSDAQINLMPNNRASIIFHTPQRAITPGQFAVIYSDNELLGSGIIE